MREVFIDLDEEIEKRGEGLNGMFFAFPIQKPFSVEEEDGWV